MCFHEFVDDLDRPATPIVGIDFTGDPLLEGEFLPLRQGITVLRARRRGSDLHAQHQAARSARSPAPRDFKTWLTEKHRADFSSAGLQAAAEGVPVPREFAELMDMLEALSADRH